MPEPSPLLNPPALVLFDCDGVLVDSETISHQVLQEVLARHGIMRSFDELIGAFMGSSVEQCLTQLTAMFGGQMPADFEADCTARLHTAFRTRLQPVPGVGAVLEALRARGIPYCVASNGGHDKIRLSLQLTGLSEYFPDASAGRVEPSAVAGAGSHQSSKRSFNPGATTSRFSAEDVARAKPEPDLFLHAARHWGADPARCVVIEDTPTGVRAACAAGMMALGHAAMMAPERLMAAGARTTFPNMAALPALLGLGDLAD